MMGGVAVQSAHATKTTTSNPMGVADWACLKQIKE